MLNWCSYCQQFQGEIAPYDNFSITHGICAACEREEMTFTESNFVRARALKSIQDELFEAGHEGDVKLAEQIIEGASKAKLRAIDILIGIIAPMLYQIGKDWEQGTISVAQEHRFTAFCEAVLDVIASKVKTVTHLCDPMQAEQAAVLLMNAPGNCHTLAIRILALWLMNKGTRARIIDVPATLEELVTQIVKAAPRLLLISMSLAEQAPDVVAVVERIAALPSPIHPRVVVGGYAVKQGLVQAIPGADLMADISSL